MVLACRQSSVVCEGGLAQVRLVTSWCGCCAVMAQSGLIVTFPGDMALRDHQHATSLIHAALPNDLPDNAIYKVGVAKNMLALCKFRCRG